MNDIVYSYNTDEPGDPMPGPVTSFSVDGSISGVVVADSDGNPVEGVPLRLSWSWRLTDEDGVRLGVNTGVIHTLTPEDVTNGDNPVWRWTGACREP